MISDVIITPSSYRNTLFILLSVTLYCIMFYLARRSISSGGRSGVYQDRLRYIVRMATLVYFDLDTGVLLVDIIVAKYIKVATVTYT